MSLWRYFAKALYDALSLYETCYILLMVLRAYIHKVIDIKLA